MPLIFNIYSRPTVLAGSPSLTITALHDENEEAGEDTDQVVFAMKLKDGMTLKDKSYKIPPCYGILGAVSFAEGFTMALILVTKVELLEKSKERQFKIYKVRQVTCIPILFQSVDDILVVVEQETLSNGYTLFKDGKYFEKMLNEYVLLKGLYFSLELDLTQTGLVFFPREGGHHAIRREPPRENKRKTKKGKHVFQREDVQTFRRDYLSNLSILKVFIQNYGHATEEVNTLDNLIACPWFLKCMEGHVELISLKEQETDGLSLPEVMLFYRRKATRHESFYDSGFQTAPDVPSVEADVREVYDFMEVECIIFETIEDHLITYDSLLVVRGTIPLDWQYKMTPFSLKFTAPFINSQYKDLKDHMLALQRTYETDELLVVDLSHPHSFDSLERLLSQQYSTWMPLIEATHPTVRYHKIPVDGNFITIEQLEGLRLLAEEITTDEHANQRSRLIRINDLASHDRSMLLCWYLQHTFFERKLQERLQVQGWVQDNIHPALLLTTLTVPFRQGFHRGWQATSYFANGSRPFFTSLLYYTPIKFYSIPNLLLGMDTSLKYLTRYTYRLEAYWFPYYYRNLMAVYSGWLIHSRLYLLHFVIKRGTFWVLNFYFLLTFGDFMYPPSYDTRYSAGWGTTEWFFGKVLVVLIAEGFFWLLHPTYGYSFICYY